MEDCKVQLEMAWLAEVREPREVPFEAVTRCKSQFDAVVWAWAFRTNKAMTQRALCERCGIKDAHFSAMLNRKKYLPLGKLKLFEVAIGNTLLSQWLKNEEKEIEKMRLLAIAEKRGAQDQAEQALAKEEYRQQLLAALAELERAA